MTINFDKPMHVYFVGIGGVSMNGLAQILLSHKYTVSGSDRAKSELTEALERNGATVYYDQSVSHLTGTEDLVVFTAAIHKDNPEYIKATELGLNMVTRAEFLGELMKNYRVPIGISGTHGKTTTTSMISEILLAQSLEPTISNGGILKSINSTFNVGKSDYFVFEACEYTNSFLSFFPQIEVILNIEADHLDFFKDLADIRNSFNRFAKRLPENGTLVINGDIDNYMEISSGTDCNIVTFGKGSQNDYYPDDISFDAMGCPSYTLIRKRDGLKIPVSLGLFGEHNVYNSLAALAVCDILGIDLGLAASSVSHCTGSKRRFDILGKFNDDVTVIDDYAHHPSEMLATINAAANYPHKRLWVVFQPHTYTRTKMLFDDFVNVLSKVDRVILTDVYAAREKDEYGCNSRTLFEALRETGCNCEYISSFQDIEVFLHKNCIHGDLLITMGAGNVVDIANDLVKS